LCLSSFSSVDRALGSLFARKLCTTESRSGLLLGTNRSGLRSEPLKFDVELESKIFHDGRRKYVFCDRGLWRGRVAAAGSGLSSSAGPSKIPVNLEHFREASWKASMRSAWLSDNSWKYSWPLTTMGLRPPCQSNLGHLDFIACGINPDRRLWDSDSMRHISTEENHD
jgi:hypothetical protein